MRKKVLIITYYWPPAGGPGVQRWLKFTKYLPDYNIEPIVYAPQNPDYPILDNSLINEISENVSVIKKKIWEPYALAKVFSKEETRTISSGIISEEKNQSFLQKIMLFIRGNFFIPDARVLWVKPSAKYLKKFIAEENIDTVITTGPPHSVHLIGLKLKQKLDLKWIADFRDPWTSIGYHQKLKLTKKSQQKHEELEKQVLKNADQIITTSFKTKHDFEKIVSKINIEVITNGYDYEKVEKLPLDEKFSVAHIGSLLSGRNPKQLWKAFSELIKENKAFAEDFQLKLVGAVSDEVVQTLQDLNLEKYIEKVGYVSHQNALELQRSAQVLLLVEINSEETKGIIPGKLFEYMVSNRPIMAVGPKDTDVEKIIKQTNTGRYFLYSEKEAIKTTIIENYSAFKQGNLQSYPVGLQKYSRKALTGALVKLIQ